MSKTRQLLMCCLFVPLWCAAVQPYTPTIGDPILEPWRWRHEESLADLRVLCMDAAEDGSFWLGNEGSISRYDGTTVTTFPLEKSLLSRLTYGREKAWVKTILAMPDHNVLALVGNGVVLRTAAGEWKVLTEDTGSSHFSAQLISVDQDTALLLVPSGVWKISIDALSCIKVREPKKPAVWLAFCRDNHGVVWVVEKEGDQSRLLAYSDFDHPPERISLPFATSSTEASIAADTAGNIWYVNNTDRCGLLRFDPSEKKWDEPQGNQPSNGFSVLSQPDGSILSVGAGDLNVVSPSGTYSFYSLKQVELPRVPFSLAGVWGNRLWLIGRVGYVYSVELGYDQWKTFRGLNFQCETEDGTQWFTSVPFTYVTAFHAQSGEWIRYATKDHGLDKVFVLFRSSHGLIWAGGMVNGRAGISIGDGTNWSRLSFPEFTSRIEPNAVFETKDGTVWFGSGTGRLDQPGTGGAIQFAVDSDRSVSVKHHYAFPNFPYHVTAFAQAPDESLWLGSTIVHRFDGSGNRAIPVDGLGGENTVAMTIGPDGTLWVAKEHFGVCRWNGVSWDVFSVQEGLAGLRIKDLLTLNDGTLLLSTDQGLSRFDGKSWASTAYPRLFASTTHGGRMEQLSDGTLWLNFSQVDAHMEQASAPWGGFCTIRHVAETRPPDTRIVTALKKVSQPGNTRVEWMGRDFLNETRQSDLQYSWRMDGGEWSAFSSQTGQSFSELKSGVHRVEVRARDQSFHVDPSPAHVEFAVVPPVWRQGWFISLISSLLGVISFLLWKWVSVREQRLHEQQEQREAFLVRQQAEQEAALRGELAELHQSFREVEDQLKQTRVPFIELAEEGDQADCEFAGRLMEILEERYSDWEFGREDLAAAFHMSLRNFQRRLTSISEHSPQQLIREFRLSRAAELLLHTTLSITDIAFKTGHDDSGSFGRAFKKQYDVTPTQYRDQKSNS